MQSKQSVDAEKNGQMAKEVVRLERLVNQREDYTTQLENETIMLRKEIKDCKYNNEKKGYERFLSGLTKLNERRVSSISGQLRSSSNTATSNERKWP